MENCQLPQMFRRLFPEFLRERSIEVPIAGEGEAAKVLTLEAVLSGPPDVKGRSVRLLVPADATAGPVFRAALALIGAGVDGIRFDLAP